jgi:hypothetical protein
LARDEANHHLPTRCLITHIYPTLSILLKLVSFCTLIGHYLCELVIS